MRPDQPEIWLSIFGAQVPVWTVDKTAKWLIIERLGLDCDHKVQQNERATVCGGKVRGAQVCEGRASGWTRCVSARS